MSDHTFWGWSRTTSWVYVKIYLDDVIFIKWSHDVVIVLWFDVLLIDNCFLLLLFFFYLKDFSWSRDELESVFNSDCVNRSDVHPWIQRYHCCIYCALSLPLRSKDLDFVIVFLTGFDFQQIKYWTPDHSNNQILNNQTSESEYKPFSKGFAGGSHTESEMISSQLLFSLFSNWVWKPVLSQCKKKKKDLIDLLHFNFKEMTSYLRAEQIFSFSRWRYEPLTLIYRLRSIKSLWRLFLEGYNLGVKIVS